MSKLTKKEKKWVDSLQKILNECPSDRIGFFTIGDPDLVLYDTSKDGSIWNVMDSHVGEGGPDFCTAVDKVGAGFSECLDFPNNVESTAG